MRKVRLKGLRCKVPTNTKVVLVRHVNVCSHEDSTSPEETRIRQAFKNFCMCWNNRQTARRNRLTGELPQVHGLAASAAMHCN